jgi:hypothetical protein
MILRKEEYCFYTGIWELVGDRNNASCQQHQYSTLIIPCAKNVRRKNGILKRFLAGGNRNTRFACHFADLFALQHISSCYFSADPVSVALLL